MAARWVWRTHWSRCGHLMYSRTCVHVYVACAYNICIYYVGTITVHTYIHIYIPWESNHLIYTYFPNALVYTYFGGSVAMYVFGGKACKYNMNTPIHIPIDRAKAQISRDRWWQSGNQHINDIKTSWIKIKIGQTKQVLLGPFVWAMTHVRWTQFQQLSTALTLKKLGWPCPCFDRSWEVPTPFAMLPVFVDDPRLECQFEWWLVDLDMSTWTCWLFFPQRSFR